MSWAGGGGGVTTSDNSEGRGPQARAPALSRLSNNGEYTGGTLGVSTARGGGVSKRDLEADLAWVAAGHGEQHPGTLGELILVAEHALSRAIAAEAEAARLGGLIESLATRVAVQADLLTARSERRAR